MWRIILKKPLMELKGELKLLIEEYESEKDRLTKLINQNILDQEYKLAHFHNKALKNVSTVLRNLKKIGNPNEIRNKQIKKIEERCSPEEPSYQRHMEFIDKFYPLKSNLYVDGQVIDDLIFDLQKKDIAKFKIIANQANGIVIHFKRKQNYLQILINAKEAKYLMKKRRKRKLKALGFQKVKKYKMTKLYELAGLKTCEGIKQDLAILFFDILGFNYKNDESIVISK